MKLIDEELGGTTPLNVIIKFPKKSEEDDLFLFRPEENFKRFNKSSQRLAIPKINEKIFFNG